MNNLEALAEEERVPTLVIEGVLVSPISAPGDGRYSLWDYWRYGSNCLDTVREDCDTPCRCRCSDVINNRESCPLLALEI